MKIMLRIVGLVELVVYAVGIVLFAVYMPLEGMNIFYFVAYIALGLVLGAILFGIAYLLENDEYQEILLKKINKKIDLLSKQDPSIEKEVTSLNKDIGEPNHFEFIKPVKLSHEDKKIYKLQIMKEFNQFQFNKYDPKVKSRMEETRDEALEMIDDSRSVVEADAVVESFKQVLEELK